MNREDEAIANIIRLKQSQAKLRKASAIELVTYKSRVIDLVEVFVTRHPQHELVSDFTVALAEIGTTLLVRIVSGSNV